MSLFPFNRNTKTSKQDKLASKPLKKFLHRYSIEVIPKTAAKVERFRDILPEGTRVYIAHIEGTPIQDMVNTARRLSDEGFAAMPHFPARLIKDRAELADWVSRYQNEAGVIQALMLGGGLTDKAGEFSDSMKLVETGLFDGFDHLHFAGHPEGNKDIDPDGSDRLAMDALKWKQAFSDRSDAQVAITTQFCFEAEPIIRWADRLASAGISLPIHIGLAGPAKIHTLMKYALTCGIGPSIHVLQRRAKDVTKLLVPYEPIEVALALAAHKEKNPNFGIEQVHFFPLGGIDATANWANEQGGRKL